MSELERMTAIWVDGVHCGHCLSKGAITEGLFHLDSPEDIFDWYCETCNCFTLSEGELVTFREQAAVEVLETAIVCDACKDKDTCDHVHGKTPETVTIRVAKPAGGIIAKQRVTRKNRGRDNVLDTPLINPN